MTLYRGFQGRGVRTANLIDFTPVLEEDKRRHGTDSVLLRYFLAGIDVAFQEGTSVFVLISKLLICRGDYMTGSAPGRMKVDDD